jgi:hypothetical protein
MNKKSAVVGVNTNNGGIRATIYYLGEIFLVPLGTIGR